MHVCMLCMYVYICMYVYMTMQGVAGLIKEIKTRVESDVC
jgi:disulfide bond formation protein DsbB